MSSLRIFSAAENGTPWGKLLQTPPPQSPWPWNIEEDPLAGSLATTHRAADPSAGSRGWKEVRAKLGVPETGPCRD